MCGITGLWDRTGTGDASAVIAMRDALSHRGPDDAGVETWPEHGVGLGHTRLAILDLSPMGHQPMYSHDSSLCITYNGEVYNFKEIRRELEQLGYKFRSESDTEVLLQAYQEWGEASACRFRGMFAYAIWDTYRRQMVLFRDRVGIKPLYYYWDGRTFAFASEIKAILALQAVNREPDVGAMSDYLTYLYIPAPKSAYKFIKKLLPGHTLSLPHDQGSPILRRYWRLEPSESGIQNRTDAIHAVRDELKSAVQAHLVSDVPVGVLLSGGIDSSTVTAVMSDQLSDPVHSFSVGFNSQLHDETEYAREVAEMFGTSHTEKIVDGDIAEDILDQTVRMYDEPYADSSAIPTHQVSALVRSQGVKVVLSGDGGDEVFGGYARYRTWLNRRLIDRTPLSLRRTILRSGMVSDSLLGRSIRQARLDPLQRYASYVELFTRDEKSRIISPDVSGQAEDDPYWYFRQHWRPDLDSVTRLQYLDFNTYLPDDILTKVDRASMAVALEVRPPLLDHMLIEKVFSIPSRLRWSATNQKGLLKDAARQWLPDSILNRPKRGFSSPIANWLGPNKDWAFDYIAHGEARKSGLLGPGSVTIDPMDGAWGPKIWALLVLETWMRRQSSVTPVDPRI